MTRTPVMMFALACSALGASSAAGAQPPQYQVLQRLHGGLGGGNPFSALVSAGGTLYGAAEFGGAGICHDDFYDKGCGIVFSLNPQTGAQKIVHSFQGGQTGAYPLAGLVAVGGVLYGTTSKGGDIKDCVSGCGTVFSFDPKSGAYKVLYSFHGSDGSIPSADLIAAGGKLYGTTSTGGSTDCGVGCGTVFSVALKTGAEQTLHFFQGGTDGAQPAGSLVAFGGKLYGATTYGGGGAACGSIGCGTIYALSPDTGSETIVHAFQNNDDPASGLTNAGGVLYGTTLSGGTYHLGTVFSLDPATGAETDLYSFPGGTAASYPRSTLLSVGGILFGTSWGGGSNFNDGTVFAFSPATASVQVLHAFLAGSDGALPYAGLAAVGNELFGTTAYGGRRAFPCFTDVCGTVFKISP